MSFADIAAFLKSLVERWNTRRGLGLAWLFAAAVYFLLPLQVALDQWIRLAAAGVVALSFTLLWLFERYWPRKDQWVVLVALESDPDADLYLKKALRGIQKRVSAMPTRHSVRFRRYPHENVLSRRDADGLLNRGKASVVIWGAFTDANAGGEPISVIEVAHYTHKLTPGMGKNLSRFRQDLEAVLGTREWLVRQKDSFSDIIRLQDSFLDSCLFILAVQMFTTVTAIDDSVVVFEFLLNRAIEAGKADLAKRLRLFVLQAELLSARLASETRRWKDAIRHAAKLETMGVSGEEIDAILARAHYEVGQEDKARSLVDKMIERDANSVVGLFDSAFFAILDKDYGTAMSLYERAHQMRVAGQVPQQIIEFFTLKMRSRHHEPAFLYARGVLQFWYGAKREGTQDLVRFLKMVGADSLYREMADRAHELVLEASVPKQKRQKRAKAKRRKRR